MQLTASRTEGLQELNLDVLFQFRQREKLKLLQSFISFFKKCGQCYGSAGYTEMCVQYALKCKANIPRGKKDGEEGEKEKTPLSP